MRVSWIAFAGLLAAHAGTARGGAINARFRVSAIVSSVCAISSVPIEKWEQNRGPARVNCAPAAPFAVSLDERGGDINATGSVKARAPFLSARPWVERADVVVVEISY